VCARFYVPTRFKWQQRADLRVCPYGGPFHVPARFEWPWDWAAPLVRCYTTLERRGAAAGLALLTYPAPDTLSSPKRRTDP